MTRLDRETVARAEDYLARTDARLARLIADHGPCSIGAARPRPFHTLARAIIGQQLSTRAAATIGGRVLAASGARTVFSAERIAALSFDQLRGAGLSQAKSRALARLADDVYSGQLDLPALRKTGDDDVVARLVQQPGIGRWTAEMFLMFGLYRPDIVSVGDLGLRRGAQILCQRRERPDEVQFRRIAARWKPYRTVACWYLWRLVD